MTTALQWQAFGRPMLTAMAATFRQQRPAGADRRWPRPHDHQRPDQRQPGDHAGTPLDQQRPIGVDGRRLRPQPTGADRRWLPPFDGKGPTRPALIGAGHGPTNTRHQTNDGHGIMPAPPGPSSRWICSGNAGGRPWWVGIGGRPCVCEAYSQVQCQQISMIWLVILDRVFVSKTDELNQLVSLRSESRYFRS